MAGSFGANGPQPPEVEVAVIDADGSPVHGVGPQSGRSTPRSPRGAGRRLGIVLLLMLAIVGIAAVNRAQASRVTGRAVADWPQPPPAGACVDVDEMNTRVVDCSGAHDAEVTRAFGPFDPMAIARSQDPMYVACAAAADDYVGRGVHAQPDPVPPVTGWPVVWQPLGPGYTGSPIYAPADQRAGQYGWAACVITPPAPGKYTGSVRGILSADPAGVLSGADGAAPVVAPAAFRICLDRQQRPASCVGPHYVEVLAAAQIPTGISLANAQGPGSDSRSPIVAVAELMAELTASSQRQCTKFAADVIGTADPTFDGKLLIRVGPAAGTTAVASTGEQRVRVGQMTAGQVPNSVTDVIVTGTSSASCTVQAAHGESLTSSMINWGDRPPPIISN